MKKNIGILSFSLLFIFSIINSSHLFGAGNEDTVNVKIDNIMGEDLDYDMINKKISSIEKKLLTETNIPRDTLSGYIKSLNEIQQQISSAREQLDANLQLVQKRLDVIGEKPVDVGQEPINITQQRKDSENEANMIKTKIVEGDVILAKIEEVDGMILDFRNRILFSNIFDRQEPLIYPKNFLISSLGFMEFFYKLTKSPIKWYQGLENLEKQDVKKDIIRIIPIILVSIFIGALASRLIKKYFGYRDNIENPTYTVKFTAAMAMFVAYGIIPSTIVATLLIWIRHVDLITLSVFGIVLKKTFVFLLYIFLSKAIVNVIFAWGKQKWRLISIDNTKIKSLRMSLIISIVIVGIISLMQSIAIEVQYSSNV
ncbi:MAG: hypothetical protein GX638_02115, partial [Crenarchaeota archaeon]|nr:hypothetical protein [Thermoproteota archaeon]